jgi:hypothetical protein
LVTYSEQFDNAAWTKNQITLTANFATSPDGSTNADRAMETSADAYHDILGSFSATSGTVYTASCFVKSAGQNLIYIYISTGTAAAVKFNLSTGTVIGTALGTVVGSKITNYGNGWYLCEVSYTAGATTTATISISTTNSTALSLAPYIGDPTKGILVYGYQVEAGAYATSYIPTPGASSVTRVADACSKTGISSLIGQTNGAFLVDVTFGNSVNNWFFSLTSASWLTDSFYLEAFGASNLISISTVKNSAGAGGANSSFAAAAGVRAKIVVQYTSTTLNLFINGVKYTGTRTAIPACTSLYLNEIGTLGANTSQYNANRFNQVLTFTTALTDAQCIELTTL